MEHLLNNSGVVLGLGFCAILLIIMVGSFLFKGKPVPVKAPPEPPKVQPPPPPKPYSSHREFSKDLLDENVSVDDVLARCGGVMPVEPTPVAEKDVMGGAGTDGGSGSEGPQGAPAPVVSPPDRAEDRLLWFDRMAKVQPKLTLVAPPKPGGPVIAMKGWVVPCAMCNRGSGRMLTTSTVHGVPPPSDPVRNLGKCTACNGTGQVMIVGG